jgi:hypothetical protein
MRARWLRPEFFTDKKMGPLGLCHGVRLRRTLVHR